MPRVLRDELEGIDFYIAQGYVEIAKDTLDRLRDENGDHPEILARYKRLGGNIEPSGRPRVAVGSPGKNDELVVASDSHPEEANSPELISHIDYPYAQLEVAVSEEESKTSDYERIELDYTAKDHADGEEKPFLVQKESGALYPDLLVQFNTSELQMPSDLLTSAEQFQPSTQQTVENVSGEEDETVVALGPTVEEQVEESQTPMQERIGTGDLLASLVSGIDASFEYYQEHAQESIIDQAEAFDDSKAEDKPPEAEMFVGESETTDGEATASHAVDDVVTATESDELRSARDELQEIFEELKEHTGDLKPLIDFETHYSLGLAFKDMELLDEAISEFQMAFRTAGVKDLEGDCINCCNMLGVCFKQKQIPKVAVMWFERGLKIPNRPEDEYQALRYEIGICYEEMGEIDKAIEVFTQVYGIDVNYRKVGDKIKELQAVTA
jgi:tetratricopeptide (TPR) repeat protein